MSLPVKESKRAEKKTIINNSTSNKDQLCGPLSKVSYYAVVIVCTYRTGSHQSRKSPPYLISSIDREIGAKGAMTSRGACSLEKKEKGGKAAGCKGDTMEQ